MVFDCLGIWSATGLKPPSLSQSERESNQSGVKPLHSKSKQCSHILGRSAQYRPIAALNNRPLDEVGILHHERNDLIVAQRFLAQLEIPIDRFAGAQELARLHSHFPDELAQLLLT